MCQEIKNTYDTGNISAVYDGIKKASAPSAIEAAPLKYLSKIVTTNSVKQMVELTEFFCQLYGQESSVSQAAIQCSPTLPIMGELGDPPTMEELSKNH